ncbi:MAG: hypothetical protein E7622_03705 [Ruminococcaceae bacterium]|nr:hypothetical protein [Oscillospiraceae bacterium]
MKKLLSLLLAMLLCLGVLVACNEEPPQEPKISSGYWYIDRESDSSVELNGVTPEWLGAYTTIFGGDIAYPNYENLTKLEDYGMGCEPYCIKIISSYEDFLKGVINEEAFESITTQTFEDNYALIVQGRWGVQRDKELLCYNDLKKEDGYYTLSYSRIFTRETMESPLEEPYVDVVIIPKELFEDHPNTIEIRPLYKVYLFETHEDIYNSSCYEITYLPVIP